MENNLLQLLTSAYEKIQGFVKVIILGFKKGSVVTDFEIVLDKKQAKTSTDEIKKDIELAGQREVENNKLGEYKVVGNIKVNSVTSPQKSTGSSGLPSWAVVLIVACIALVMLCLVIAMQRVSYYVILDIYLFIIFS